MRSLDSSSKNGGDSFDSIFYNSIISLCISEKALHEGSRLHSHMASTGFQPSVFLENQFINLYAKCGEMEAAQEVFNGMHHRNSVSWNAMISGYCLNRRFHEALLLFREMTETGPCPDQSTYLSALRASVGSGNPRHGEQIHTYVVKTGFFEYLKVGNALINMYAKLGNLEDAETVYEIMVEKDEVSWNSIITANAQNGCSNRALLLLVEMQQKGLRPDEFAFGSVLGSSDKPVIKELHAQITKGGYERDVFVMTTLLDAYSSCGSLQDAYLVFNKIPDRNTVAWNTIIAAYTENGCIKQGLQLFQQMGEKDIHPDEYTIASLLKAMAVRERIEEGKQLHVIAIKLGLYRNTLVGNTLITMYSKHGEVSYSRQAFENIAEADLVSWNSMIQSYVQNDRSEEALAFFLDMKLSGIEPDEFTFIEILAVCAMLSCPKTGKAIHGSLIKSGPVLDAFLGSSLVDMYAKFGNVSDSKRVFDEIEHKDLITWNSMIVGFSQNGFCDKAMELLCLMLHQNLEPDNFTFANLLSGFGDIMGVQQGRQIHSLILKSRLIADIVVANALITMYASVGSIKEAEKVFYGLTMAKTVVTWNSVIQGYAQNGFTMKALELFDQMEINQVKPNSMTFVAILTACSHAGLTKEAEMYFNAMNTKYGIAPGFEHHACMIDILGRTGKLEEAENLITRMPYEPNALVWRMLLSGCRIHGDLERGKRSMEKVMALEPGDSAAYVLLSNIYAAQGKWKDVIEVRKLMRENRVKKEPGKSWIEVHNMVHEFVASDHSHPQTEDIYSRLRELLIEMKIAGYEPDAGSFLQDMDGTN
ncbi:Pentatricopeptide repeat [Macleaya cordata]|uniref:Pentatricopeptide repeat n=1 Tax=Macleaya cordata TaxID=56857 RepID=A0A200QPB0_MACCD|nr:Pentatricopeptide repeat [Macleaya cordata]